jgi:general secretion pathway protein D
VFEFHGIEDGVNMMKTTNGDSSMNRMGRWLLCLLCIGVWGAAVISPARGARVAGDEGVTSTRQAAQPETPKPARTAPPKIQTPPETPKAEPRRRDRQRAPAKKADRPQPAQREAVLTQKNSPAEAEKEPEKNPDQIQKTETPYVTIDFDNVDIEIFIKFISELTGKNFVVDKAVRGKVTIISPKKISVNEAYKVFESVLEVHGFTTVPSGSIIKIVPAVSARSKDIQTRLREEAIAREDKVVTQLIPLRYADPNELKKLFAPLISKSSVIVSYPPTGMLIITDVLSNIKRLLRIVDAIDVEGIGQEISIIPLQYATASQVSKTLTTLFQQSRVPRKKGVQAIDSVIKIVPDERTNVLITLASEYDTQRIRQLIKLLDKETPRGEGDIRVYYLQNANAEDLAKVLMAIPSETKQEAQKGKAPILSKEIQIVADNATNSLVITAGKADYIVLEDVIKKLDIPRRMVYIEALLMEVSTNKDFQLGVQWQAGDETGSYEGRAIATFGASIPPNPITTFQSVPSGFSLGVLGESITINGIEFPTIAAVINALQTESDVNILSTPQIMTTDNEEAEIIVADNIPFLTRQDLTSSDIAFSQYEFKDVGVTLNVTPQINQERFVRLKISQEVSQVVDQEEVGLPTTLKRQAKTTVIVKDGHTIVFGGLIDETLTQGNYQVPCLGSVPGLGWLFKSESRSGDRTNLFLFLTPHIVENPKEADELFEQKKEQIDRIEESVIKMNNRRPVRGYDAESE